MATSFFGGAFFGGEFFNTGSAPVVVEEEATRPRPADGEGKTLKLKGRTIFKPTGLIDRPRTLEERVQQSAEIAQQVAREVTGSLDEPAEPPPIIEMTLAEVEREIGVLLRKKIRTEEDELILLLLMAAAAAG
jgi:hypothetical protein